MKTNAQKRKAVIAGRKSEIATTPLYRANRTDELAQLVIKLGNSIGYNLTEQGARSDGVIVVDDESRKAWIL